MSEEKTMIQIDNVSKEYKLGEIGGTTLRETFQRLFAKILRKEDPTRKIGTKNYNKGEKFLALNGINLTIKKGERIGIIGHNGAGKSTLLKLICRVTAPTTGEIGLNGRITSMLEVGTGFHPELTGRENIYVNGAILGMTKKEIDEVIEEIIDFSEVREFIDTPVKRYSSGMYVKLAFSVAAHLKSEIMIMDEVLAVGDMAFQNKCLAKMRSVSEDEGRTILYVSHNMNTIRQLCGRVIVLNHGNVVFDGEVEEGISKYLNINFSKYKKYDFSKREYDPYITAKIKINSLTILNNDADLVFGDKLKIRLNYSSNLESDNFHFRFTFLLQDRTAVATSVSSLIHTKSNNSYDKQFVIDTSRIAPGDYLLQIVAFETNDTGTQFRHDYVPNAACFSVANINQLHNFVWDKRAWGNQVLPDAEVFDDL